jgi:hypothetical protein
MLSASRVCAAWVLCLFWIPNAMAIEFDVLFEEELKPESVTQAQQNQPNVLI